MKTRTYRQLSILIVLALLLSLLTQAFGVAQPASSAPLAIATSAPPPATALPATTATPFRHF